MQSFKKIISEKFVFLKFSILLLILLTTMPIDAFSSTKIMLAGDSITYGYGGTYGGYRGYLYDLLQNRGYDFDFVGSQTVNSPSTIDPHHEGYAGWRADNIRDYIYGWLVNNPAELVLLHVGTNDISGISDGLSESVWKGLVETQVDEVSQVLDEIDDFSENTSVILARIISRLDENQKTYTTYFNQKLQEMVAARSNDNLTVVDMENSAGLIYSTATGGSMFDDLHPNNAGYSKMATVWSSAISAYDANIPCSLDSRFQTATLQQSMNYYTDRSYVLTNIPTQYLGMATIKTPNEDQLRKDESNYLKFKMPSDATLYVAYDSRATSLPDWMDSFTYTGEVIYTSLASQNYMKIYSKAFSQDDCVDLGANYAPGSSGEYRSNYFVFYGVVGAVPTCTLDAKFEKTTLASNISYYTDRSYILYNVPSEYLGMSFIKTPNADLASTVQSGYMKFELQSDATVYVAYDSRATSLPNWMGSFSYTGNNIYTSLASQNYLKIYRKTYLEGDCVDLGGNYAPGSSSEYRSNYVVFYGQPGVVVPPSGCTLATGFQLGTIQAGTQYYTDRTYTITGGIPDWMTGRTLIKTGNDNDERLDGSASGYLTFTNSDDWWVYVLFDSRSASVPSWLDGWELRSDIQITTSLSTQPYLKVYRKQFAAGDCVDLGGNYGPGSSTENRSNFAVVYGQ